MRRLRVEILEGDRSIASFSIDNLEGLAYIMNKYSTGTSVSFSECGIGFLADLPKKAAVALEYLAFANPTNEKIDEIVVTGMTELHRFVGEIGFDVEGKMIHDIVVIEGKDFAIDLWDFPEVSLILRHSTGTEVPLTFQAKGAEKFLKRLVSGRVGEDEIEVLRGISILDSARRNKFIRQLSSQKLSKDSLARELHRLAILPKNKEWKRILHWLRTNGYYTMVSEIIAKRTLCEDQRSGIF